ncbi:alcohol dehydrogenase-like regulatory protein ErcA [Marispirochaeta aestuarii]|uniref:alcohol dehydrogenase-like regulatory protein ErcA n=1 Tax=Marispirochaeta aestuarii TaxID=1963862 RepID=UPI002ABD5C22|nr:alcohol dehydrogenase-like regulatory protein ErcA [Marispirochaeta aestuarii]
MQVDHGLTEMRKFVAPEFIFGIGARKRCPDYIRTFGGGKVLLVSDPGVEDAGWTQEIAALLRQNRIPYVLYDSVSPNPRDTEVMKGAEFYLQNDCSMILVVGGGSPIDCAKGIGIVVSNDRSILSFEGVDNVPVPMPPLICIPTTAGTSADVSQFAIILDTGNSNKIAIVSKGVVPDISLIDPETTKTMDMALSAETGMDALTHAVEAFVSNASSPVTDMHALRAVEYLALYLPRVIDEPQDSTVRSGIMMGSLLAGLAFSNASLGLVHAMAHSLGGLLDLPHGLCNSLLLEHVSLFNFDAEPEKYRRVAAVLSRRALEDVPLQSTPRVLQEALKGLREILFLGNSLDAGPIDETTVNMLAHRALNDPCTVTNPKDADTGDLIKIYEKILHRKIKK